MTSIKDVPYQNIKSFLINNKVSLSKNEQDNYNTVFKMISNDNNYIYSDIIIDWIVAYNLNGKKFRNYSRGEIDIMSDEQLNRLDKNLGIDESNNRKQSVINVLKFLKKLDSKIVMKDIDNIIFQTLDEQRILSSNYKEMVTIFRNNKTLRKFIYDNLPYIIETKSYNEDYGGYMFDNNFDKTGKISDLVVGLLKLNEIILAKEVLKVSSEVLTDDDRFYFIQELHENIIPSGDEKLIEKYLILLPYIRELFPEGAYDDAAILDLFSNFLPNDFNKRIPKTYYPILYRIDQR